MLIADQWSREEGNSEIFIKFSLTHARHSIVLFIPQAGSGALGHAHS